MHFHKTFSDYLLIFKLSRFSFSNTDLLSVLKFSSKPIKTYH